MLVGGIFLCTVSWVSINHFRKGQRGSDSGLNWGANTVRVSTSVLKLWFIIGLSNKTLGRCVLMNQWFSWRTFILLSSGRTFCDGGWEHSWTAQKRYKGFSADVWMMHWPRLWASNTRFTRPLMAGTVTSSTTPPGTGMIQGSSAQVESQKQIHGEGAPLSAPGSDVLIGPIMKLEPQDQLDRS